MVTLFVAVAILAVVYGTTVIRRGFSAADQPSSLEKVVSRTVRNLGIPSSARNEKNPWTATPETLQAILPGSRMRRNLATVKAVVVDELLAGSDEREVAWRGTDREPHQSSREELGNYAVLLLGKPAAAHTAITEKHVRPAKGTQRTTKSA